MKPANILISQSGAPILSDFGIAKILVQSGSTQLTGAGVGIGTPDYMAPEQWTGTADARTDIYSLGVVFYQMVTGRLPFSADTPAAVLIKHLRDPLPRPRTFVHDLPDVVEQVLFKALAKEPENRFQTMKEFASTLEKLERSDETVIGSSALDFETVRSVDVSGAGGNSDCQAAGSAQKENGHRHHCPDRSWSPRRAGHRLRRAGRRDLLRLAMVHYVPGR